MKFYLKTLILFVTFSLMLSCENETSEDQSPKEVNEESQVPAEEAEAEVSTDEQDDTDEAAELDMNDYTSELTGIEKHYVKNDPLRLYTLLKFKEDMRYKHVGEAIKEDEGIFPDHIIELDQKSGYIQFSQPSIDCITTMVYWNLSNGEQLIGRAENCCTMFCDGDVYFQSYTEEDGYVKRDVNLVIPEYHNLRKLMPEGHVEEDGGYDTSIELPKKGKNIKYCTGDDCKELIWKDGIFSVDLDSNRQENTENVDEAVNVPASTDPREDPDYVGTPCKYVDGECIRHDHDK